MPFLEAVILGGLPEFGQNVGVALLVLQGHALVHKDQVFEVLGLLALEFQGADESRNGAVGKIAAPVDDVHAETGGTEPRLFREEFQGEGGLLLLHEGVIILQEGTVVIVLE
jgi:hypothetical protein